MRVQHNIQSISAQVLEALSQPKVTDREKAKIIAEGFAQVEKKYLNVDNLATTSDLRETELKLNTEISHNSWEIIKWMIGLFIAIMIPIIILY